MWLMNTRSLHIHGTIVPMGCMLLRVVDCPNRTVRPAHLSQPSGVPHPRGPVPVAPRHVPSPVLL